MVHDLAQSGLRSIDYASGRSMQLDTAVRLALRTGCHQLAGKIQDENIRQTGENLVYVSKHRGARNTGVGHANHEQWQGRVYFIKEGQDYREEAKRIGQDYITDLWRATGYSADGSHENDPVGLYGYNCRHNHYVWFEGVSDYPPDHNEKTLAPITVNGKTYDYYAMTQKLRSMERNIRALKREKEALSALGMDTREMAVKIRKKTAEYKEFCGNCGVPEQTTKLRYECGTAELKKTEAWKEVEVSTTQAKKAVTDVQQSVTMNVSEDKGKEKLTEIYNIGRIDTKLYKEKFGNVQTDEVIVTNERIEHIKSHHPEDYELFELYGKDCIADPDLIISDEKNVGTVFLIKKLPNTNLNVVLRLVLENEDSKLKNSVMTFWRIRKRNVEKLIEKNQILYKKE